VWCGVREGGGRNAMNAIRQNLFSLLVHSCGTIRCSGMLAFRYQMLTVLCVCWDGTSPYRGVDKFFKKLAKLASSLEFLLTKS
jgi:hypothetical protein